MRPVNLLPAGHRARSGAGGQKGSSYVLLGVLGALLVGVVMYVLAANQVTDRGSELAQVQAETQAAQQKAAANAAYGNFSQIKATRLAAVTSLAQERFDWERMAREIAHVLPKGVDLTALEASLAGDPQQGAAASNSGAAASASGAAPQPSLKLSGCAPAHPDVADTLVRLRRLHRVEDVTLSESTRMDEEAGSGGAACSGKQSHSFAAVVKFELAQPEAAPQKVPARLGGGS